MSLFDDQWRPIVINGVTRQATKSRMPTFIQDFDGVFFVDSPTSPRQRIEQHRLRQGATAHLERGGSIRTSGCQYSLPPEELRRGEVR